MATYNLGNLIPDLRLNLGDIDPANQRYTNDWLKVALYSAIKSLGRWWNNRYLLDNAFYAYRNPTQLFIMDEPPVIMQADERPIIIVALIMILGGSLSNNSWNLASWRDAEISFSNLESGRIQDSNIKALWEELTTLLKPPSKKLAWVIKNDLPGYKPSGNQGYEHQGDL